MKKFAASFIFLCAILAGYYFFPEVANLASRTPAATTTKSGTKKVSSTSAAGVVKKVSTAPVYEKTPPELFLSKCNCSLPFIEPNVIAYEDALICPKERRYFDAGFAKMPAWIKAERQPFPEAEFGRECLTLVMKSYLQSAQSYPTRAFANCQKADSPIHARADHRSKYDQPMRIACVTKDYVNATYNAVVDVADCLNLPQKEILVKLFNESGFHLNTFGPNGDAGIGQLTGDAIGAALEPYWKEGGRITVRDYYLAEIGKSNKASCQRIINNPAAYQKVKLDVGARCSLMAPPENPYRNMLYTGLFYRTLLHNIAGIRFVNGKDYVEDDKGNLTEVIPGKDFEPGGLIAQFNMKKNLKTLGLVNPDMHALTNAIVMLGYNAGPRTAAAFFDVYLRKRVQTKKMLKPADVDFLNTDFVKNWAKLVGGIAKTDRTASKALKIARQSSYLRPLPEFLMIVQDAGAPGYITKIAVKHKELIDLMGDNRCVSEKFLHF